MITPPKIDAYALEAFDYGGGVPSLDTIATRVYGRKYEAQQTGDMLSNDTYHQFDLSDPDWRADLLDDWAPDEGHLSDGDGRRAIAAWQALPVGPFGDIEGVRAAPQPGVILADLIERGELPAGRYMLRVSW